MFTHATKTFDQLLINKVLKKIRVIFARIDNINKDLIVI